MTNERFSPYNALPSEHEAVSKYKPVFLARGGDHLVYEVAGHPDTVIKASTFKIQNILSNNAEKGLPLEGISDEMRSELEKEIAGKNEQIRLYREYFGADHTLSERRFLMQVPISDESIQEIFKDDWKHRTPPEGSDKVREVWTAGIVQAKSRELANPEHVGLYFGGFVEERKEAPDPIEYEKLNAVFLKGETIRPEDLELFFTIQDNPHTHAIVDLVAKAKEDPTLRSSIESFLHAVVRFATDTGNILAMAREDNVIFYPHEGAWNYQLIDAIPIYNDPVFTRGKEAQARASRGETLTERDTEFLIRARNFTRTINGLAAALGLEDRLVL